MVLLNPFITLWLGSKYILNLSIPITLAVNFYIEGLRSPGYAYRTSLGLFEKSKSTPYIGAITNIVLSILLCKFFGVVGIFIATSISLLVSYAWIDPYLIHKYEFKTPIFKYFKKYLKYAICFTINSVICFTIVNVININGILGFIIDCIIVLIIPNLINFIIFNKVEEFQALKNKFIIPFLRKFNKKFSNI